MAYNWWSLFVRLANPKARMGAITSRPLLLSGVGRKTIHAGQRHLTIAPLHGKASQAISLLTKVSQLLKEWEEHCGAINSETGLVSGMRTYRKACYGTDWLTARTANAT